MPTSETVRRALLQVLPDMKDGVIVDLGSGWGHLVFPLARKYRDCHVFGYENSPIPFWFSSLINYRHNLKILRANFYKVSLHEADLVICYLFTKGMERLKEKLEKELRPKAHVISHTFAISSWQPKRVIEVGDLLRSKIYVYEVPT